MTPKELAGRIDHTLLKADATGDDVRRHCDEAVRYGFFGVCVNPIQVGRAVGRIEEVAGSSGSRPVVVSVAGFPLGATHAAVKADEARWALDEGAREIDMVADLGALRAGDGVAVRRDIEAVADVVRGFAGSLLKVILETQALTQDQIILGCRCCAEAQADFVKTSTGFHPAGGATLEDVRVLYRHASPIRVKASGGIRTADEALVMIGAGAARIGASASVWIVDEYASRLVE